MPSKGTDALEHIDEFCPIARYCLGTLESSEGPLHPPVLGWLSSFSMIVNGPAGEPNRPFLGKVKQKTVLSNRILTLVE